MCRRVAEARSDFQLDLTQPVAIFAQLGFNGIATLGAFAMLGLPLLHGFRLLPHLLGYAIDLRVKLSALLVDLGKFAGQHHAQLGAHFVAELGIALRFRSLPLQRIHLPRDFVENIVHASQVLLGVFQARLGQPLLGLELGDAGGFFEDGAAVGGPAAENLPDASLLDQRIRLRPEASAHEQFLNIAEAAQLAVEQIFAIA